jgi:hypothetical protein
VAYGITLAVVTSKLQKYRPEYFLNTQKIKTMISIALYQAIAVAAVKNRGIVRLAPHSSKMASAVPFPAPDRYNVDISTVVPGKSTQSDF